VKNILHLCESSETGGAESVLIRLVEGLDKNRYRSMVCLLSDGWLKDQLEKRRIETVVIPQPHSFDVRWLLRAYRLLKEHQIHVMHSHEFATNVYASFLSWVTGVPVVATAHGKNYYGDKWRRRAAYRFAARHSVMVAVSNDLKRFLTERIGILPRHIRVVHNGIDLHQYSASETNAAIRAHLGIGTGQRVIGTVGNLFAVKGHTYLLKACKAVVGAYPNILVLIAGEGDQLGALEKEASDLGIAANVRFLGFRDDVPALLHAMDVFVLPSLSEGLPLAILEALALGKPVVATHVGGIPEVVQDGLTGFLVAPKDPQALAEKILLLLRHPETASDLGRAGRRRVEDAFSIKKMIHEYQWLYENTQYIRSHWHHQPSA
jgi:sugar transferase (PEP-CTERM/EpsH1 system associated)